MPSVKEEITSEIRKYFEMNKTKTQHIKTYGVYLNFRVYLKQCLEGNW